MMITRPWRQTIVACCPTLTCLALMVLALVLLPGHVVAFVAWGSALVVVNAVVVAALHPLMADLP